MLSGSGQILIYIGNKFIMQGSKLLLVVRVIFDAKNVFKVEFDLSSVSFKKKVGNGILQN